MTRAEMFHVRLIMPREMWFGSGRAGRCYLVGLWEDEVRSARGEPLATPEGLRMGVVSVTDATDEVHVQISGLAYAPEDAG